VQSGVCFTCHNPHLERMGNDPTTREVPQLAGLQTAFRPDLFRPFRDYHLVDPLGKQTLPPTMCGCLLAPMARAICNIWNTTSIQAGRA
jgi:hypothetical protein